MSRVLLILIDFLILCLCFFVGLLFLSIYSGFGFRSDSWMKWWSETGGPHFLIYTCFALLALFQFAIHGLYSRQRTFWDQTIYSWKVLSALSILHLASTFLAKWPIAKTVFVISWLCALFFLPFLRAIAWDFLNKIGTLKQNAILYCNSGLQEKGQEIALQLGYRLKDVIVLDSFLNLQNKLAQDTAADNSLEILLFPNEENYPAAQNFVQIAALKLKSITLVPPIHGLPITHAEIQPLLRQEALVLQFHNPFRSKLKVLSKRVLDIVASALALILLSPLFALLVLWIRQTRGPAFFGHLRVGKKGKLFHCYKFRSMHIDAEQKLKDLLNSNEDLKKEWEKEFKLKVDPRITSAGNFLRKTSLDELPQLWNVLKGNMSLVGPRPVTEKEMELYEKFKGIDYYLAVRPGITGLWQVSGRNNLPYSKRVALDSWYVKNWSLWYDLAIIFETVRVVILRRGAF